MSREKYLYFFKITKSLQTNLEHNRLIWSITFGKNVLYFDIIIWSPNLDFGVFIINFYTKVIICAGLYINFVWYILLYSFTISSNLSRNKFFGRYWIHIFVYFIIQASFSNNRFSFKMYWINFNIIGYI